MSTTGNSSPEHQPHSPVSSPARQTDVYETGQTVGDIYETVEEEDLIPIPVDDEEADPNFSPDDSDLNELTEKSGPRNKGKGKTLGEVNIESQSHVLFDDRPNKYYGPASTWRSWTREERQIAESLIQLRNQDLSAHLYNAHALKIRRRRAKLGNRLDIKPFSLFAPERAWTAWPMPPSEVPRRDDGYVHHGSSTNRAVMAADSVKNLEESLLACTLRMAKERFQARPWENETTPEPPTTQESPPRDSHHAAAGASTAFLGFSSQAYRDDTEESEDESGSEAPLQVKNSTLYQIDGSTTPVFIADDDKARQILLPSIRESMGKLDRILQSLYRAHPDFDLVDELGARPDTPIKTSISRHTMQRKRSRSLKSPQKRMILKDDTIALDKGSPSRSRSRNRSNKRDDGQSHDRTAYQRDWSDVLAMAAVSGLPTDVVARAAERCAKIFEEDMQFRTFYEGDPKDKASYFTEATASGLESTDDHPPLQVHTYDTDTTGDLSDANGRLPCPHDPCRQQGRTFKNLNTLNKHFRLYHRISRPSSRAASRSSADIRMAGMTSDEDTSAYYCPVLACKRHTQPFSRSTKMYSHVRNLHPELDIKEVKRLEIERRGERRGRRSSSRRQRSPSERDSSP